MGVTGLWKLIEPCGQPVPVDTLESKVLAVDISIWLHQVVKGFQDNKGSALPNAHLLGLFHRLCKLLYYRVKPVFVFDGCVPQLKRDTIARRQLQRSKLNSEAERIQALLLQSLAKEKVVQQALGNAVELLAKSPNKRVNNTSSGTNDAKDDLFKLPEMPSKADPAMKAETSGFADPYDSQNDDSTWDYATTTSDESFDDSNPRHYYNSNLQAIDVRSEHFKALPADVRHDILVDIKETRKQSSWGRLHELPAKSDDFSSFQMKRLLKRRAVQESIEEAQQEMGGRTLTFTELQNLFTEEGIVEPSALDKGSNKVSSDENTRFLLVRDLKKKLAADEDSGKIENLETKLEEKPCCSQQLVDPQKTNKKNDSFGEEYDKDLELAIALSLEQSTVYNEKDYEYDSDENLKLTKEQSKQLKNAAIGPARAFMIEYAGINDEELLEIMEKTQNINELELTIGEEEKGAQTYNSVSDNGNESELHHDDLRLHVSDSETNFDMEAVEEETHDLQVKPKKCLSPVVESLVGPVHMSDTCDEPESHLDDLRLHVSDSETNFDMETEGEQIEQKKCSIPMVESMVGTVVISDTCGEPELHHDDLRLHVSDSEPNSDTEAVEIQTNKEQIGPKIFLSPVVKSSVDSSDTDSDLEEVPIDDNNQTKISTNTEEYACPNKRLEVVVDLTKPLKPENDLFSDIFETNLKDSENKKLSPDDLSHVKNNILLCDPQKSNVNAVLDELKKQAEDIPKIKLDDIKIDSSIIELSDDETHELLKMHAKNITFDTPKKKEIRMDIIEIPDDEYAENKFDTKSPRLKTPSKDKSILEYYQTDYVIKRTPEGPGHKDEKTSEVKSPFFVNKTPKSNRKRSAETGSNSSPSLIKVSKAAKSLFPSDQECTLNDGIEKIDSENNKTLTKEDLLNEAANALREQVSADELKEIASSIAKEKRDLENERNRQDRMGMSISQRMNSDCQELLRLFGIPYIVAPMEAEAQCAFLDAMKLTNGTITDDSDIWLFGGRTVYKNFFAQNKHVLEFRADNIEKSFNCDRGKFIQLACLVGSDYTTGIHGIGAVTAMEILATFCSKDRIQETESSVAAIITTLRRFRDWWIASKSTTTPPGSSARLALRKKLKNIELHEGFPNIAVIDAYLSPKIDDNKENFTWGFPDVESIRAFARKTFGWTTSKTDDILMPVIKKINEKKTQATIKNYFSVKSAVSMRQLKVSKRIQNAIDTMSGKIEEQSTESTKSKPKRATRKKSKAQPELNDDQDINIDEPNNDLTPHIGDICNSSAKTTITQKGNKKKVVLPSTKEIIPQRERDLEEMREKKEIAAKILNKTKKINKKKSNRTTKNI